MNRPMIAALIGATAFGLAATAQQAAPGHPTFEPQVDADHPAPPPADPADVASIDAIVNAFYASISGAKGQVRDWDRFRSLFQPDAHLLAARPLEDGSTGLWVLSVEDFVGFNKNYFEKGGYFEKEAARRVENFGMIAQVWSTYEARHAAEEPDPYLRGIYSMQLLKDGDRWWIVNLFWDYERPNNPIPQKYLEDAP